MSGKSNHYDAMTAIQTIVQGIGLTGICRAPIIQEVLNYKVPDLQTPVVLIAPWGPESYDESSELNDQDAPVYGIAVAIVADAQNPALNLEDRLQWRQQIRRRMKNASLPGLSQSYQLNCKPFPVVDQAAWMNDQKFISGFLVTCSFQEPRS